MYGPRATGRATATSAARSTAGRRSLALHGRTGTGSWSMHAYGLAVDLNPVENPYVGCGQSRDPAASATATAPGTGAGW